MTRHALTLRVWILCLIVSASAMAQAPAPTPLYSGSLGGGLAITSGNSDTNNFNLTFELIRDPKKKNLVKVNVLYLRGSQNDVLSVDRAAVTMRDEYTFAKRTFLFAQMGYLHDQFKDIQYLLAPIGGIGYKLIDTDATKLSVSGGPGGYWEKNLGLPVQGSGSVNVGESFSRNFSKSSTFTQSFGTLWKTNDFGNYLTTFAVGLAAAVTGKIEVKIEFLDTYKTKPPKPTIKKNDTAFVTSFVMKF